MKIALAQFNPVVGDIAGNTARMAEAIDRSVDEGVELVVFSELSVVGYPPRDLLRKEAFVARSVAAVEQLAAKCTRTVALVGFVRPAPSNSGRPLQNAAALLAGGGVRHVHVKTLLPTYDVFDETRYFQPGGRPECIELCGRRLGVSICEDLWDPEALGRELYDSDPIDQLRQAGAEIIINMAASPFEVGKSAVREQMLARRARQCGATIVFVNQVGGNDELIFDGASCLVSSDGDVLARAASFREDLLISDTEVPKARREPVPQEVASLSAAIKLGLRDYVHKCGFRSVVLGLSGGIDSAVVATLAADALGPENVHCLAMPSRFSSAHSLSDAQGLAECLGVHFHVLPIEQVHAAYEQTVGSMLAEGQEEIALENIQARIRGNIVMAVSNAFGHLPMATGNKSELSTGYCTLYGDMCGALAPIGDVLKTDVYRLADELNTERSERRIPPGTLTKPPSAELKPGQLDQDKLPPYEQLDAILQKYIEQDKTAEQIVADGLDEKTTRRVIRMVDAAEHKRRQAPPVLKVTRRAFGTGRRMPIARRFDQAGGR